MSLIKWAIYVSTKAPCFNMASGKKHSTIPLNTLSKAVDWFLERNPLRPVKVSSLALQSTRLYPSHCIYKHIESVYFYFKHVSEFSSLSADFPFACTHTRVPMDTHRFLLEILEKQRKIDLIIIKNYFFNNINFLLLTYLKVKFISSYELCVTCKFMNIIIVFMD